MNTLSNEFYRGFKVDTAMIDGYHMPFYIEFTAPELSFIWLSPLKAEEPKSKFDKPFNPIQSVAVFAAQQGSLFD